MPKNLPGLPIQHLTPWAQGPFPWGFPSVGPRLLLPIQPEGPQAQFRGSKHPKQASKRSGPSHKLPKAYSLALAAHVHRSGFAAPEIPQAAHMGRRVLPKGIPIPLHTLRQRFITRSAFPVSSDPTASMQDDFKERSVTNMRRYMQQRFGDTRV
jgi:hypothetical protein